VTEPPAASDPPTVTTLDVWRVPTRSLAAALWQVATFPRGNPSNPARFSKLLGTSKDRRFGPISADLSRWAAFTVWRDEPLRYARFDRIATQHCRLRLALIQGRGTWSGRDPFEASKKTKLTIGEEPVLALTRARIRPARTVTFWRAIDPVAATLPGAPGLLAAFGVGEAPVGVQGTVSIWAGARDLTRFAYRTAEHANVVAQTSRQRWYAEELFARLVVLSVVGDREVLGWNAERA
jgi:hypothetical protein